MKKFLRNSLAVFLSMVVLCSSSGIVIASHFCSSEKKSEVGLYKNKSCCSKSHRQCAGDSGNGSLIKKNCCKVEISYHRLDVTSLQKPAGKWFDLQAACLPALTAITSLLRNGDALSHSSVQNFFLWGKPLLIHLSLFRI